MSALEHLAADLRAACPDGAAVSWAHITGLTLSAAQAAGTSSSPADALLRRRTGLNDALYRAFMARKHGQRWTTFDGPTLLLALDDLCAATHAGPRPSA